LTYSRCPARFQVVLRKIILGWQGWDQQQRNASMEHRSKS